MTLAEFAESERFERFLIEDETLGASPRDSPLTFQDFLSRQSHVHLSTPKLRAGDLADEVELPTLSLGEEREQRIGEVVRISDYAGEKPVALVFGSYTCPPFRASMPMVEYRFRRFADHVAFFIVYAREVHPEEGWVNNANRRLGIMVNDPTTREERGALAERLVHEHVSALPPVLIEEIEDKVTRAYGAFPIRLCLIGTDGRVVYQGGVGPFAFDPQELEVAIRRELDL